MCGPDMIVILQPAERSETGGVLRAGSAAAARGTGDEIQYLAGRLDGGRPTHEI